MTKKIDNFSMNVIGVMHSCFKEKFGIPRQPGLASQAKGRLELFAPYNVRAAVAGLEQASHIWVQFVFHESISEQWKASVRPPRLGGNKTAGVFATRSPMRPNKIGLSAMKLDGLDFQNGVMLLLSGIDLLDGTPILDIKPYIPYADKIDEAENRFAPKPPAQLDVVFSEKALLMCQTLRERYRESLKELIEQVLGQDPRPQYHAFEPSREYGMKLLDFDVKWRYELGAGDRESALIIRVLALEPLLARQSGDGGNGS